MCAKTFELHAWSLIEGCVCKTALDQAYVLELRAKFCRVSYQRDSELPQKENDG